MAHGSESFDLEKARFQFHKTDGLPFSHLLNADAIYPLLDQFGVKFRVRIFTPIVTIWTFLSQVLSPDRSCREAIARVLAWRVAHDLKPCSPDSTSYCQARARLPLELIRTLVHKVARRVDEAAPDEWLWKGRPVKIVDGSTVTMPDTPENRKKFPPSNNQANGVSFPIARLVVIFSYVCGTVLDVAFGPMRGPKTGETTMFRRLFAALTSGDIVLGDRLFDSYRDIATLRQKHIDVALRMNGSRKCDFRRGKHLGVEDHRVTWKRPTYTANRFDRETYDALPEQMEIRELRYRVSERGFRPRCIVVVTTLLDPEQYPADDLAELYRDRWYCELNLRALKTTLQMDHLRCRTPEMVEKEVWMYMLAYNLLREVMTHAARENSKLPRRLSFKGAMQTVNACLPYVNLVPKCHRAMETELLRAIAQHVVGDRPNRTEPRAIKTRKTKYPYLMKPRGERPIQQNT